MLPASAEMATIMQRLGVPPEKWPVTIEQMFSSALRRAAALDGAYAVGRKPFPDLLTGLPKKADDALWDIAETDDAWWYVRAPAGDIKEAFAAWVTAPERRTAEVYAAFEPLVRSLREVVTGPASTRAAP